MKNKRLKIIILISLIVAALLCFVLGIVTSINELLIVGFGVIAATSIYAVYDAKKKENKSNNAGSQMLEWKKDGWKAVICLAPALLILAIFTFYPIIKTFIVSFFPDYNYQTGFFGSFSVECYTNILTDPTFWRAMGNTAIMVLVSVPLCILLALLITVALNSIKALQGVFQVIFFLPYVTNGIAFGIVFATIFSAEDYGLINSLISMFGGEIVNWTGTGKDIPYWAGILVITVYSIWNGLAFKILVFLSGIQGIDKQYYQAAQVDATPKWRVFTKITIPLLSPMILYITITSLMGAFKSYSSVVSLFGDNMGPVASTADTSGLFITAVGYIYEYFNQVTGGGMIQMLPLASAAALILFVFIMIITFVQMWANKKKVHY